MAPVSGGKVPLLHCSLFDFHCVFVVAFFLLLRRLPCFCPCRFLWLRRLPLSVCRKTSCTLQAPCAAVFAWAVHLLAEASGLPIERSALAWLVGCCFVACRFLPVGQLCVGYRQRGAAVSTGEARVLEGACGLLVERHVSAWLADCFSVSCSLLSIGMLCLQF